jgi:hypothetical protein
LYVAYSRKYQEVTVEKDVFEDIKVSPVRVPKSLAVPLESQPSEALLSLIDNSLLVYQSLFFQAAINRDKV